MSFDREHPILVGAVVYLLIKGDYDGELKEYNTFTDAMAVYGYSAKDCYHITEDLDEAYDKLR